MDRCSSKRGFWSTRVTALVTRRNNLDIAIQPNQKKQVEIKSRNNASATIRFRKNSNNFWNPSLYIGEKKLVASNIAMGIVFGKCLPHFCLSHISNSIQAGGGVSLKFKPHLAKIHQSKGEVSLLARGLGDFHCDTVSLSVHLCVLSLFHI